MFFQEYIFTLSVIIFFGLIGGFFVLPFRNSFKYIAYLAPCVGFLVLITGTAVFYNLLHWTLQTALYSVAAACSLATIFSFFCIRPKITCPDFLVLFSVLSVVAIVTYLTNFVSINMGSAGFLYMDGTDHLGYAHLADWLNDHTITFPKISPDLPYQSWPEILFSIDTRFGSFFAHAIIACLKQQSGMFSYDSTSGIVLSVFSIGISSVFARSRYTFILLLVALLTGSWYDYSRSGYLGKLLGYPAAIFIAGLFMTVKRPIPYETSICLALLTAAAASLYFAPITALILFFIFATYILISSGFLGEKTNFKRTMMALKEDILVALLLIGISIIVLGMLSKQGVYIFPANVLNIGWLELISGFVDVESAALKHSGFTEFQLVLVCVVYFSISSILFLIALRKRDAIATILIGLPILTLAGFVMADVKWITYQMIGLAYPLFLCGAARLMDNSLLTSGKPTLLYGGIVSLFILAVALHIPRFYSQGLRYASMQTPETQQFSQKQMEQLISIVGKSKLLVDIDIPQSAIAILVEFGRRNVSLQWTPRAWNTIVPYRHWPEPKVDSDIRYVLMTKGSAVTKGCTIKLQTNQYQLLDCR